MLTTISPRTHELRNEVVEELILDLVSESRGELDTSRIGGGRSRGMGAKRGKAGKRGHKVPLGEAYLSEEREAISATDREVQAVAKPSEVAKPNVPPKSLTVTCPDVEARARKLPLLRSRSNYAMPFGLMTRCVSASSPPILLVLACASQPGTC